MRTAAAIGSAIASARGLPAWLAVLPLLPATADPRLALVAGTAAFALLALARPALALLAAPRATGTRWAAALVVLATLAAGLARLVEAAWPTLPPSSAGGLAPMLMAVGVLAHALPDDVAATGAATTPGLARLRGLAWRGLLDGARLVLALLAIAGARAVLGPLGDHPGAGLAAVALLAALAAARRPRPARVGHGSSPPLPPSSPPPGAPP